METILLILGSTILISIIAFVGIFTLAANETSLRKILLVLVGFSAGVLMGGAFLHLIPEASEASPGINVFLYLLLGFIFFFILEKFLRWRHCHKDKCDIHAFSYLNLIGDGVHNFIDGLIIAAAFVTSPQIGMATFMAVAFHEIPQEIGDFGVLIYGGMKRGRALLLNFVVALTVVIGGVLGYLVCGYAEHITIFLLPLAAGGFIYIAASDLIPELHKELDFSRSMTSFVAFLSGIGIMWGAKLYFGG